jgi:hypothetical protein
MTTRMNFKPRKDQRRKDAEARQVEYDKLSFQAKVSAAGAKVAGKLTARGAK